MSAPFANALLYWTAAVAITLAAAAWQSARDRLDPWSMYLAGLGGLACAAMAGSGYAALLVAGRDHAAAEGQGALGAFAGAAGGAWLVLRLRGERFLHYADAAVPAVALGYATYRIGCFFNGCCAGTVTAVPWGVRFGPETEAFAVQAASGLIGPDAAHTLPVHPTQLYHAVAGLAGFAILLGMGARPAGARLAAGLAFYGVTRLAIEFLRADAVPVAGPLDVNQLVCLAMIAAGAMLGARRPRPGLREGPA